MSILRKMLIGIGMALAVINGSTVFAFGTIHFTGEITEQACTVDSSSKDLHVDLGKISSKNLSVQGELAGLKDFTIKLTDCPENSAVTVRFGGNRDPNDQDLLAINSVEGAAKNVGIAIFEKDAVSQIKLYDDSKEIIFTSANIDLDYTARYKATGVVTAGSANSSAVYSVQYQ